MSFSINSPASCGQQASEGSPVTAHVMCGCSQRRYGRFSGRIVREDGPCAIVRDAKTGSEERVAKACLALVNEEYVTDIEAESLVAVGGA